MPIAFVLRHDILMRNNKLFVGETPTPIILRVPLSADCSLCAINYIEAPFIEEKTVGIPW